MIVLGISGAPSSGKTTLASGLTSLLKEQGHVVTYVTEYARDYIKLYGNEVTMADQVHISLEQLKRERAAKGDIIVTDCPVFLGAIYSERLLTNDQKDIMYYMEVLRMGIESARSYRDTTTHALFHIRPRRFIHDNVRNQDSGMSMLLDQKIKSFLTVYGDFVEIPELKVETRIARIVEYLKSNGIIDIKDITEEDLGLYAATGLTDAAYDEIRSVDEGNF